MRVLIIGAGGHAQVVADSLASAAEAGAAVVPLGYVDDAPELAGQVRAGLPVLGAIADRERIPHEAVVVAIGDNALRRRFYQQMTESGEHLAVVRHPSAVVARDVILGPGTVLCAGVIVNTGSAIGANVILNTGCTVDHHSRVGDHVHVAPGVHTGGEVEIGEGALIGVGATLLPRCRIGAWGRVGGGAVVLKAVASGETVAGVPARRLPSSAR